jgi:hypothetical protein
MRIPLLLGLCLTTTIVRPALVFHKDDALVPEETSAAVQARRLHFTALTEAEGKEDKVTTDVEEDQKADLQEQDQDFELDRGY